MKLFLIDGHALVFKMYYAFLGRPMINARGEDTSILFGFTKYLLEMIRRENPTHIAVGFDPPGGTFRNQLYPEYKANRGETPQLVIDALEPLSCANNAMTSLDVSTLESLTDLDVNACGLTALDVSHNVELVNFDCSDNNLSTLRVTNNIVLDKLDCSNNTLANINVRKNTALRTLNISGNADITALALGYNVALEALNASGTAITDIDLDGNQSLKDLRLTNCTSLSIIILIWNKDLNSLFIDNTSITSIDLSYNKSIITLQCEDTVQLYSQFDLGHVISINNIECVAFYNPSSNHSWVLSLTRSSGSQTYASNWCSSLGTRWSLPSKSHLEQYRANVSIVNSELSQKGKQQFTGSYWSSSIVSYGSTKYYWIVSMDGSQYTETREPSQTYPCAAIAVI